VKRLLLILLLASCGGAETDSVAVTGREGAYKTSAPMRAARRAYDGAPPVIPHERFGPDCITCHNSQGVDVPGVGFAPPSPHESTEGLSSTSRCTQCHVFRQTEEVFVKSTFEGVPQDLRSGTRAYTGAPPVMPHPVFMRENCLACHSGPAAREEVRTTHPERTNCAQCHVAKNDVALFERK
jgi:cytochrome c-type protein NapB